MDFYLEILYLLATNYHPGYIVRVVSVSKLGYRAQNRYKKKLRTVSTTQQKTKIKNVILYLTTSASTIIPLYLSSVVKMYFKIYFIQALLPCAVIGASSI